jgi:O-acetyl-ADP-ribose deacetylase (regulator of RNase III)
MAQVTYIRGDATCPQGKGVKLICHVCNDLGGWGKGFVLAISKRWKAPEEEYRRWYANKNGDFGLGKVQFVQVGKYVWVANMIGQRGMKLGSSGPPIRYDAVALCLQQVAFKAQELDASVHMPMIGCGLARGKWSKMEPILEECLTQAGIEVMVYKA